MAIPNQVIIDSPTNTVEIQTNDNQLHIISPVCNTEVNVTQPVTTIIQVAAPGPQGQKGELNPNNSGSFNITGSLDISGSLSLTGNLIVSGSSTFIGPVTGNITGSLLGTASFADQATSASYALSSSYAVSASYAFNAISASYALTASYLNPIIQNVLITGSLTVSGSSTFTNIGPSVFSGSIFQTENTASLSYVTASIVKATSFTGSLLGTASFADNATSASYALSSSYAVSASYAQQATSASYALSSSYAEFASQAESASYSISGSHTQFAISASYALSSSNAISSSYAISASYAFNATSASYALSGSYVISASYAQQATSASFATTASYALNVNPAATASYALQALSASYALSGSYTQFATSASYAFQATSASYAVSSSQAARAVTASFADTIASGLNITASNLFVAGAITASSITAQSASFGYVQSITGSVVIIGQEYIILNTQAPAARFAGLKVYDSGSNHTGSLVWDSLRNHWVYENEEGASYSGGGLMSGPRNTGSLGDETYPTLNTVLRGQGGDHLYNSNITDDDSNVRMSIPLIVTGSVRATSFTGSVSGSVAAPGSTTQIVYNNGGVLAADSGLVYSGSNVGIGTNTPTSRLQVSFPSNTSNQSIFRSDAGDNLLAINTFTTTNRMQLLLGDYNGTSTPNLAAISDSNTGIQWSGGDILRFVNNGSENVTINASGNVGIGEISPGARLEVKGSGTTSATTTLRIENANSSASLEVRDDRQTRITSREAALYVEGAGVAPFSQNIAEFRYLGNNNSLIISQQGGSAGLTTSADTNLNINPSGSGATAFLLGKQVRFINSNSNSTIALQNAGGTGQARLDFITGSTTIMSISGSGNVGIKTATPGVELDVVGSIRASSIMFNTTTQTNNIQTNSQNLLIKGAGGVTGITMDQTTRNVGIGITTPSASLHVSGNVLLGTETDPALFTSQVVTANTGITTIYALPTSSYEGAFFDYTIRSGSNSRAGQIIGLWSGSSVNYTEVTTLDFGNTSGFNFGMSVSSSNMILSSSATTSGWAIRTIIRSM
jgi:hypothetical protein